MLRLTSLKVILLAVFVSGCIYKGTVYIDKPREFSERVLATVYTNLNLSPKVIFTTNRISFEKESSKGTGVEVTTNTNFTIRNIFSYSILDNIYRTPSGSVGKFKDIVCVEISSTAPEYIYLVRKAVLQEIYIQEGGTIPPSSIGEKSYAVFLVYSLLFPGLSLSYAVSDNVIWDIDFEAVKFDEASGIVVSQPVLVRSLGILAYGILSELMDKFLLLYSVSSPWTISFDIYLLTALIIRVPSVIIGLDLINKHNTIISSGYNVDRNFSVSLLYNKGNYPLVEVRMFQVRF